MRVVIVGGRDRRERDDYKLVTKLLDDLKAKYPVLLIVTVGCDRGVGKIINNRLMPAEKRGAPEIDYIEYSMKLTVDPTRELSKQQTTSLFLARNATLVELGDEFHLFLEQRSVGIAEDLRQRCSDMGKPHAIYRMGETEPEMVNWPEKR